MGWRSLWPIDAAPWVRISLGASRVAGTAVVLALGAYAIVLARSLVTRSARHAVVAVAVGIDRRITLTEASGERIEGLVHADSYVGAILTTIVVRLRARRRLRTVAILPDMLLAEDFRRLRVLLRLGRDDGSADICACADRQGRTQ